MRGLCALLVVLGAAEARAQCSPAFPQLCELPVQTDLEQPNFERAVDVVLVGDGFTDLDDWRLVADNHVRAIREQQVLSRIYSAVPAVYNFHIVDVLSDTDEVADDDLGDTALGVRSTGQDPITADAFRAALAAVTAPDVDVVYIVANANGGRANATFPSTLASGGTIRMPRDPRAASHELGHAVMRLADEYIDDALCPGGDELSVFHVRNVTADPECYRFSNVEGIECRRGNLYCRDGFFRSARQCLMRSSGNVAPCPVCARTIERTLLQRRTFTDQAEPWPVVELPREGAEVRGRVAVRTWVWDDYVTGAEVFLELDGAVVAQAAADPWAATHSLDTRALPNGEHVVVAVAVDGGGHHRRSLPRRFVVANGVPGDPPVVVVETPVAEAEVVRPNVPVLARITDALGQPAIGIEQTALLVDGELTAASAGNLLNVTWDASRADLGAHTLEVVARGADQVSVTSGPVPVTLVGPGAGGQPPELLVVEPTPWAPVGAFFVLRYRLAGVLPGARAELLRGGIRVGPLPLPEAEETAVVAVDASDWALGAHELRGRLFVGRFEFESPPLPVVRVAPVAPWVRLVDPPEAVAGEWPFEVISESPAGVDRVTLHASGLGEVARGREPRDTLTWRTANAEDGCRDVWAEVRDLEGASGISEAVEVCVHNQAPRPVVVSPVDGAAVAAGAVAVHARLESELLLRVDHALEVREDGVLLARLDGVRAEGTVAVGLEAGVHVLTVRAVNAFGGVGETDPVTVRVDACEAAADCDDEDPCTADACAPSGLCLNPPQAGCCRAAAECEDGDPCTAGRCEDGACVQAAVEGCCNHAADCVDDGDPCTVETCPEPGGACAVEAGPCCAADEACDDGDACTADTCVEGFGVCAHDRDRDCCAVDLDCDDDDPCTEELCRNGRCVRDGPHADCCRFDFECDDGDACTADSCVDNDCRTAPVAGCCVVDGDCETLNPCAGTRCEAGRCVDVPEPGCCVFDSACEDEDVCTVDSCTDAVCTHRDNCCLNGRDCDDGDLCTADLCLDGFCEPAPILGCCHEAADCDDGDVCTAEACVDNQCVLDPLGGCCNEVADCEDGDVCTAHACADNLCEASVVAGCCNLDPECDDDDVCTTDHCVENACTRSPVMGCCNDAAECDDGDVCTVNRCLEHACQLEAVPNCCNFDFDCRDDGDPCTRESCVENGCVMQPVAGCGLPDAAPRDAAAPDAAVDVDAAHIAPDAAASDATIADVDTVNIDAGGAGDGHVDGVDIGGGDGGGGDVDGVDIDGGDDGGGDVDAVNIGDGGHVDAVDIGGDGDVDDVHIAGDALPEDAPDESCDCAPVGTGGAVGWWWLMAIVVRRKLRR